MVIESSGIIQIICDKNEIIFAVQNAMINTLGSYSQSAITAMPVIIKNNHTRHDVKVVGTINLLEHKSEKNIILLLGFGESVFMQIYENTFQEKIVGIDCINQELAGELLNIVFQTIDPELQKHGHIFTASLPEVYSGENLVHWQKSNSRSALSLVLPFSINNSEFYFELSEISLEAK
jgi:CheY-specific phosphatase CheX